MDKETPIIMCELIVGDVIPGPTDADLVRPDIRARREGNTIIATVPTSSGSTQEVSMTCSGTAGRVSVAFSTKDNETFDYTYLMSNDPSTFGNITWLRFNNLAIDDDTRVGAPPKGWLAGDSVAGWIVEFKNDKIGDGIAPGERTSPFTLHSRFGPGLRCLVFGGHTTIPNFVSSGVTTALYEVGGPFSDDSIYSVAYTLAPKIEKGLEAVRAEIEYALSLPEFAVLSGELREISEQRDANSLKTSLLGLQAHSLLQRDFIRAMCMNLERK